MPRGRESLQYQVKSRMEFSQNDVTKKSQKVGLKFFIEWAKSQGVRDLTEEDPIQLIQRYSDYMQNETSYTPGTIHTRLAPVCKALDVPMGQISKPRRTQASLVRGRHDAPRAKAEAEQERYSTSVDLQKAIGIRRRELWHLQGADLVEMDGRLYIHVLRGKGGKEQYQAVLPLHEDVARAIMSSVESNQVVLTKEDLGPHIDYHGMRADLAREAYSYYLDVIQTGGAEQLQYDLKAYYAMMHPFPPEVAISGRSQAARDWMERILAPGGGVYKLRGQSRIRAIHLGRPVEYDRLALLATSVYHLSHWRLDVTVTNYMLH